MIRLLKLVVDPLLRWRKKTVILIYKPKGYYDD